MEHTHIHTHEPVCYGTVHNIPMQKMNAQIGQKSSAIGLWQPGRQNNIVMVQRNVLWDTLCEPLDEIIRGGPALHVGLLAILPNFVQPATSPSILFCTYIALMLFTLPFYHLPFTTSHIACPFVIYYIKLRPSQPALPKNFTCLKFM